MNTIIAFSTYLIGLLFFVMILSGLTLIFVERTIQEIKRRKTIEIKQKIDSYTSELSRWCDPEFQEVIETCDAIHKLTHGEGHPDAAQFRSKLRNKQKRECGTR